MKLMLPALLLSLSLGVYAQDDDELLEATSEEEATEVSVPTHPWEKPIFHRVLLGYSGTVAKYSNNSVQKSPTAPRSEKYFLSGLNVGYMADLRLMKTKPFYIEIGANLAYLTGRSSGDSIYSFHENMPKGEHTERHYRVHAFTLTIPINLTWQFRDFRGVEGLTLAPFAGVYGRFNIIADRRETAITTLYDDNGKALPTTVSRVNKSLLSDNANGRNGWMEGRQHTGKTFQVGAQLGVNAFYKKYSFGVAYMIDIMPFAQHTSDKGITYKSKDAGGRDNVPGSGCDMKVSTMHNFAITLGYVF